jgi:tetraacyldisaccharide 4'-kinase
MDGRSVLAVSAVGDPDAFSRQLQAAGARVEPRPYPDHHHFTADDVARLATDARGVDLVVCTLKDAVKLDRVWPRAAPPLWYVSQLVLLERGELDVERILDRLLASRRATT